LKVAEKLAMFNVKNAVRFCFWTAEEVSIHGQSRTSKRQCADPGTHLIALLTVPPLRYEQVGLVGSTYYVNSLSQTEVEKIRMNLNFDMLASPNYIYMIFDGEEPPFTVSISIDSTGREREIRADFSVCPFFAGDGDAFGLSGPTGSSQIEKLFQNYFDERDTAWNATAFDGRSDYGEIVGLTNDSLDFMMLMPLPQVRSWTLEYQLVVSLQALKRLKRKRMSLNGVE
jgi:carboxypeptidase Q